MGQKNARIKNSGGRREGDIGEAYANTDKSQIWF
jgi:hypothetical protein